MLAEMGVANVFAAANNRFGCGKAVEFRPQPEGSVETSREASQLPSSAEKATRLRDAAGCGETCDLPFDQGRLHASDARGFARAENIRDRGSLKIVYLYVAVLNLTAQQQGQFDVRNKMKTTGKIIAWEGFYFPRL